MLENHLELAVCNHIFLISFVDCTPYQLQVNTCSVVNSVELISRVPQSVFSLIAIFSRQPLDGYDEEEKTIRRFRKDSNLIKHKHNFKYL